FSRATMGEGVGADLARDLDLAARDERPGHRRSEKILAAVNGASTQGWIDKAREEFFTKIFDIAFVGARSDGFLPNSFELGALANVRRDANHLRVVVFL